MGDDDKVIDQIEQDYFGPREEFKDDDYKALVKKLEQAADTEALKNDPKWQIFEELWHRTYDMASLELDKVDPTDWKRISHLQMIKLFYKDMLRTTIRIAKEEGKLAYEQAKDRGILNNVFKLLSKDLH